MATTQKTFYFEESDLNDLLNIAFWDRDTQKDAIGKAVKMYVDNWKTEPTNRANIKNGKINQRPEGK